ncbi:MAG TPA: cadherin domain-containing protein, partial [Prolixibacteraceae bacterium]|nr:cadherin domain-containing protein [Prolixibacteraceae bacterium]
NHFSGVLPVLQNSVQTYRLSLSANEFTGSIPDHYGDLNLQYLDVQSNNLSGIIPAGLFKGWFTELYIQENFFTFADIEPVLAQINALTRKDITSTKKYPLSSTTVNLNAGETLNLNAVTLSEFPLGGNNNRYKWFKNDVELYSGNNPSWIVPNASTSDAGTYRFEVTNTVVAGVTLKSDNILVNVLSDNQAPTDILLSQTTFDENYRGLVGVLSALDPDEGDQHTFSLTTGDGSNDADNSSFTVAEGNQLFVSNQWNFEYRTTARIHLSVDDGAGGIFSKAFVLTVNDVNEAPVYNGQVTHNSIDENAENGAIVFQLMADDPEGATVIFSILSGNDDGAFGIEDNRLIVADHTKLDYETQNQYSLVVSASDGSNSSNAVLNISLNQINSMPRVDNAVFALDENAPTGTLVGSITASDPEGDPLTYSFLTGNELSAFRFNGNTLEVDNSEAINYEANPVFTLTINVSDGISNVQATVTVNLNDVDESNSNPFLPDHSGQNITFYPNPVRDVLTVFGIPDGAVLSLTSLAGVCADTRTACFTTEHIDVQKLKKGIYILSVQCNQQIAKLKVLVR